MKYLLLVCAFAFTLTACSQTPAPRPSNMPKEVKTGKPYTINGKSYTPEYNPLYDETGVASWYGPGFDGNMTANGEIFNQDDISAAHTTLPLPSLVRVTNMQNGKSLVVRVNDRGPFVDDRIIDLSRGAARQLDIHGLADVRVQYLKEETERHWADLSYNKDSIRFSKKNLPASTGQSLHNTYLEKDDMPVTHGTAAPVMSVASTSLTSQPLNDYEAPRVEDVELVAVPELLDDSDKPSTFNLISSAQAQEISSQDLSAFKRMDKPGGMVHLTRPDGQTIDDTDKLEPAANTYRSASRMEDPVRSSGDNRLFVQAGSFSHQDNAEKLGQKLQSLASVEITPISVNGRRWHRVRLGPFGEWNEAQRVLDIAEDYGAHGARIISE